MLAIRSLIKGKTIDEVADFLNVSQRTIYNWGKRWNKGGIDVFRRIQLTCRDTEVEFCRRDGIRFNDVDEANEQDMSTLNNVTMRFCNLNIFQSEAGLFIDNSNPIIFGSFIHENDDYGIYITDEANPRIQGIENNANTIIKNSPNQGGIHGSEIRIAHEDAMELEEEISNTNLFDVRPDLLDQSDLYPIL